MEYQKEALSFVLREDFVDWVVRPINDSAAMVFEETAGATLELAHLEPLVGSRS